MSVCISSGHRLDICCKAGRAGGRAGGPAQQMKRTSFRWAPPLVCLSSALSLLISVPAIGDVQTVMTVLLAISATLIGVAGLYRRKAWVLRTLSSICSSASIATMITFEPDWRAVLGCFLPLIALLVVFGPAWGESSGPGWDPDVPSRGPGTERAGPGRLAWTAVSGYLLLAESVLLQFVESSTSVVLVSFLLSIVSLAVVVSVSVNRDIQLVRTMAHIAGIAAQVYICSFNSPNRGLLIASGVISGILSIPATL